MSDWFKIRSATRLALSVTAITAMLVFSAQLLKLVPDTSSQRLENRVQLCEALALQSTSNIKSNRLREFSELAKAMVERSPELRSMALRRSNGAYAFETDLHPGCWVPSQKNSANQVSVYIDVNGRSWGTLEVCFVQVESSTMAKLIALMLFLSAGCGVMSWVVLSRTLRYLNPNKVVPQRVRSAFETLAGGLMLLDRTGVIVHANGKLASMVGTPIEELIGANVSDLAWETEDGSGLFSWQRSLKNEKQVCGEVIRLNRNSMTYTYTANSAPIFGSKGNCRGVMVSFDDVTALENKKADLARMVDVLKTSRDQVTRQNKELKFLASRDPLTKCFNRRSFWEVFDKAWQDTEVNRLSLLMIDIDHFKSINDTHGHSVGDDVLRDLGDLLIRLFGEENIVCRFGGEEFAILLLNSSIAEAFDMAGQLRNRLVAKKIGGLNVTASIGVSNGEFGAMDPQHLLDQADQSLYVAKRNGRDRAVRFDGLDSFDGSVEDTASVTQTDADRPIEYSVVSGLLTAMAFRSSEFAQHSLRVAKLSVAIGQKFLKPSELYELEIAALLHDVGVVGTRERLVPGRVSREGDESLRKRDAIGAKIVELSFGSTGVAEIIQCHRYWYADFNPAVGQDVIKHHIPAGARIVSICNQFDKLLHRKGKSVQEAVQLLENGRDKYDPEFVQELIRVVVDHPSLIESEVSPEADAHDALVVGKHVEELYSALESMDRQKLQFCVSSLQRDAAELNGSEVCTAANELALLLQSEETCSDEIHQVARQVIELCRNTRDSFVSSDDIRQFSEPLHD